MLWDDTDSGASPLVLPLALPVGHALLVSHFGPSIAVQWTRRDVRPSTRAPPPVSSRGEPRVRFLLSAVFRAGLRWAESNWGEALSRLRAVVHVIGHELQHISVKQA